jgi:hypothetical protein
MKNKIAIASAFLAASSFSMGEIVINDFLSFEGFVDMSYSHTDGEIDSKGSLPDYDESDNSFDIDQVEIDWLFDFDPVTAQIDLQYEGGDDYDASDDLVEQAFVTYHMDGEFEGVAITAGRYASMLGFEAFEPTGLYQYSVAYDMQNPGFDINGIVAEDDGDLSVLPGYAQGVKATYETDNTFFGLSIQDEAFDTDGGRLGGDDDEVSSWAVEVAASIALEDGVTFFLGGAYEDGSSQSNYGENAGDTYVINGYVTYETGAWLFAAELTYGDSEGGRFFLNAEEEEALQGLVMANFAYSDVASVTGRVSYVSNEDSSTGGKAEFEAVKYTIAHNYAFTDNLLLVTELGYVDGTADDMTNVSAFDADYTSFVGAVELLFSF